MSCAAPSATSALATRSGATCSIPTKLVKDLRTGVETSNVDAVLQDGDLDRFVVGYHRWAVGGEGAA